MFNDTNKENVPDPFSDGYNNPGHSQAQYSSPNTGTHLGNASQATSSRPSSQPWSVSQNLERVNRNPGNGGLRSSSGCSATKGHLCANGGTLPSSGERTCVSQPIRVPSPGTGTTRVSTATSYVYLG